MRVVTYEAGVLAQCKFQETQRTLGFLHTMYLYICLELRFILLPCLIHSILMALPLTHPYLISSPSIGSWPQTDSTQQNPISIEWGTVSQFPLSTQKQVHYEDLATSLSEHKLLESRDTSGCDSLSLPEEKDGQASYKYITSVFRMSSVSGLSAVIDGRRCSGYKFGDLEALGARPG